jgi:hypothetical protein
VRVAFIPSAVRLLARNLGRVRVINCGHDADVLAEELLIGSDNLFIERHIQI